MWRRSIRVRITGTFALLLAAVMVVACAGLLIYARRSSLRTAQRTLRATILRVQADLGDGGREKIGEIQEDEAAIRAEGVALIILDGSGRRLWATRGPVPNSTTSSREWVTAVSRSRGITIVAGMRRQPMEEQLRRQGTLLGLLAGIVLLVATTGAWIVVGRTLRPIHELARQAADASVHSLDVALQSPSADAEVTELVQTLNDLLGRIAQAAHARGRFYAAASHELRTPLQALSGHLALALMRTRSAEEYRNALEEANAQARRLVTLVQDLLLLHQLDTIPAQTLSPEDTDLASLCAEELRRLEARLQARALTVATSLSDTHVRAYPGHLQILLRNLLDNAAKYATPGTQIEVQTTRSDAGLQLRIFNQCAPLSEGLVDTLFEPFARLHVPRTRDPQEGNGLGLAICHAIAQANRWILRASAPPGGFEIVVLFPERV
ncbi:MAG: ATP-binding protein [Chthonomonadales bacterium]